MLHLTGVRKKLGDFTLDVDRLEIATPGVYGLVGHNGCGKSTLAKLITGILTPDSGRVHTPLGGGEVTMVATKPYMMDDTVINNLAYPLQVRGIKNRRELCEQYLGKAGFSEYRNRRARGLSSGERQKLALLRAMIFNPRLLILDESMTDLDVAGTELFTRLILEQQARNRAVCIVISHRLSQIRRMCSHVFLMSAGRIEAQGASEEVLGAARGGVPPS